MAIEIVKFKKNQKKYRVRIRKPGQKVSRYFIRYFDAVEFEKKIKSGTEFPNSSKMTFAEATNKWINEHAEIFMGKKGVKEAKRTLEMHLLPIIGDIKIQKVEAEHIVNLIKNLKSKNLMMSSIKRILTTVNSIFNFLIRSKCIQIYSNPMFTLNKRKLFQNETEGNLSELVFWSKKEVGEFLGYAKNKYLGTKNESIYLLYKVALNTGMRLGELRGLDWSAVNFERKLITVKQSYCDYEGIKKTKSKKVRYVPISDPIFYDLLDVYKKQEGNYVFQKNGQIIRKSTLRTQHFVRDLKESGVRKIRFHDLRHTFASYFVMNGGNLYELQAILGHSKPEMTQRYAHLSSSYLSNRAIVSFGDSKVIQVDFQKTVGEKAQ